MFTSKETELLTLPYFNVISDNTAFFEIQSINTGHFWAIIPLATKNSVYYQLLHKYREEDTYHIQTTLTTVLDVILEIINHDDYKLHRRSGYFEEIVQKYSHA